MLRSLTVITLVAFLVCVVSICLYCGPAEYEVQQECCPMCSPGYYVHKHCTEHTSTTCAPCPPSSYIEEPSGLTSCMSCAVCDSRAGLRARKVCSLTSDTLCEPLDGYYCIDPIKDGCREAVEHTKCSPGQYIKQAGSAYSDTVCVDCDKTTYSDGSFRSCRPHTQCEPGYEKVKNGTSSSDTECRKTWNGLIIGGVSAAVFAIIIVTIVICRKFKRNQKTVKRNETRKDRDSSLPLQDRTAPA